ncbi:ABC transporter ATP-binding protein [Sporosarcina sp. HYO08]|uniref:ABC transporter ATP-binding protein n=1 Tax=Sporosarcina sp. HYO08 TaxID=1759557 RepID=UPI000796190B|nr:ABC transporter ATP-binding protein [Sporosarcina sp. HYO08]KXH87458.1 nitrate ABC transporter ATP-binding protein [Sporosarcina sp. HYO08]
MSGLVIDSISHRYDGSKMILQQVNYQVGDGEFHCLVGRSGCGKTTFLKIVSGLLEAETGQVLLDGQQVKKPLENAGFVFQSPTLLEWKTVLENVLFPIELKRKSTKEEQERAKALLALMKIEQHMHSFPQQLSGGQQSRVAIARALIKNPRYLFLDEPFAALDAITREELQDDLLALCAHHQMTVLFITHDIAEAIYVADHVLVMEEGKIVHTETIDMPKPRTVEMRYSSRFNELGFVLRQALEGVPSA